MRDLVRRLLSHALGQYQTHRGVEPILKLCVCIQINKKQKIKKMARRMLQRCAPPAYDEAVYVCLVVIYSQYTSVTTYNTTENPNRMPGRAPRFFSP